MFTVIYMAGSALMEAGWSLLSRYYGAEETGAALVYTRTAVWNYISQVFPAAAGCPDYLRSSFHLDQYTVFPDHARRGQFCP